MPWHCTTIQRHLAHLPGRPGVPGQPGHHQGQHGECPVRRWHHSCPPPPPPPHQVFRIQAPEDRPTPPNPKRRCCTARDALALLKVRPSAPFLRFYGIVSCQGVVSIGTNPAHVDPNRPHKPSARPPARLNAGRQRAVPPGRGEAEAELAAPRGPALRPEAARRHHRLLRLARPARECQMGGGRGGMGGVGGGWIGWMEGGDGMAWHGMADGDGHG